MLERGINSPLTSSMGRFLDACAAILGICEHASYDGEPAIELEAAASRARLREHGSDAVSSSHTHSTFAPFAYASGESRENRALGHRENAENVLRADPAPLLTALLDGIANASDACALACAVHAAVARMAADVAAAIARERGLHTAALGGGVFMNRLILEETWKRLEANGLRVLVPECIPLNDGGIAYGQAAIARARYGDGLPSA